MKQHKSLTTAPSTPIFRAGQRYRIRTQTVSVSRTAMKIGNTGEEEEHFLKGCELAVWITGENGKEHLFMDRKHAAEGVKVEGEKEEKSGCGSYKTEAEFAPEFDLETLAKRFQIPTCPDVGKTKPEGYRKNLAMLDMIEQMVGNGMRFKPFQRRDLSRGALHDGLILAEDPGCGKTIMGIAWALLKLGLHPEANGKLIPSEPVLIVCPGNLHRQMVHDYENLFGAAWPGCTELVCQDTFLKLSQGKKLKPGYYISSFTAIASNKIKTIPEVPEGNGIPDAELTKLMQAFGVRVADAANHRLVKKTVSLSGQDFVTFNHLGADAPLPKNTFNTMHEEASIHDRALNLCAERRAALVDGVDKEVNGIRCVYSPSLADLVRHAFGCVCIDEAVRIKSEDSIIGVGVRSLCPKYRLVLTGTPIKNRLPDIFFLAAWACNALDEANARWPYAGHDEGEMERFAVEFTVMARNLTKEAKEAEARGGRYEPPTSRRGKQRRGKPTAEVANVHRLWKLLAPVVLRRRKADIGEDIVPKIRRPIVVPMGTEQAKVIQYHLNADYVDKNGMPAIGAQLQALRSCAAAPCSPLLESKGKVTVDGVDLPHHSKNEFTPRVLATLRIVEEILLRREQVVIASAFHEGSDGLARFLSEAGVDYYLLDGRMSPSKRGELAMEFKMGLPHAKPILLAGNRSCGEGYSFEKCNNLIQFCWDWALDVALQMSERVHRLNSRKAVNIYPVMCKGTIDAKLESLISEKGDSAELVLDGKLIGEVVEEVNLHELLRLAHSEFTTKDSVDERDCQKEWPALCARLNAAYVALRATPPLIAVEQKRAEEIVVETLQTPMKHILTLADLPSFRGRQLQLV